MQDAQVFKTLKNNSVTLNVIRCTQKELVVHYNLCIKLLLIHRAIYLLQKTMRNLL